MGSLAKASENSSTLDGIPASARICPFVLMAVMIQQYFPFFFGTVR
jgi:hypothetical protein